MDWTPWPDDVARCPGTHGAVGAGESVARLLHSKLVHPLGDAFRRSELFSEPGKQVSNECGNADGLSVVRSGSLSDVELRQRSLDQAILKPERISNGAVVAQAAALRRIEVDGRAGEQVVFIYDDPLPSNPLHAVVRGKQVLDRPERIFVRDRIREAFSRIVAP